MHHVTCAMTAKRGTYATHLECAAKRRRVHTEADEVWLPLVCLDTCVHRALFRRNGQTRATANDRFNLYEDEMEERQDAEEARPSPSRGHSTCLSLSQEELPCIPIECVMDAMRHMPLRVTAGGSRIELVSNAWVTIKRTDSMPTLYVQGGTYALRTSDVCQVLDPANRLIPVRMSRSIPERAVYAFHQHGRRCAAVRTSLHAMAEWCTDVTLLVIKYM